MDINPVVNSATIHQNVIPSPESGASGAMFDGELSSTDSRSSESFIANPGTATCVDPRRAMKILQDSAEVRIEEVWRANLGHYATKVIDLPPDKIIVNGWTALGALNPRDGRAIWKRPLDKDSGGIDSIALGKNNTIVASTNQASPGHELIFAVDGRTGKEKWSQNARRGTFFEKITAGQDGRLYAGSSAYGDSGSEDRIVALNGDTGAVEWQFKTGDRLQALPLLGPDNSVLFGCHDHKLYSIDGASGKKHWDFDSGAPIAVTPVSGPDGSVVCVNTDGVLTALDAGTGKEKWSIDSGGGKGFTSGALRCSPDGTIFAVNNSTDSSLWAIDGKTGKVLWSKKTDHWVQADPLVDAEGNLYIGTRNPGSLRVYDGKTGREMAKIETGDLVDSLSISQDGETIYCGTSNASLIAFRKLPPESLEERMAKKEESTPEIIAGDQAVIIDNIKLPVRKD